MIISKRLVFIAVIALVVLLATGNLVRPALANNAGAATPMPTGTPMTDPNGQSGPVSSGQQEELNGVIQLNGEPASLEQQEELKDVIQSYFEIRYRALSVSNAETFKQSDFGRMKVLSAREFKPIGEAFQFRYTASASN